MALHVGQRVICVDGEYSHSLERRTLVGLRLWTLILPIKGGVYTIRGFDKFGGLWVEEIVQPVCINSIHLPQEPSFNPLRFRPIIERKTDIGVFEEILRKINQGQKVET